MRSVKKAILPVILMLLCIPSRSQISVSNETELRAIAGQLSGHYMLTGDILLSQPWTPVGDKDHPFTGVLDGGGYAIRNLRISGNLPSSGLFAYTDKAEIINLGIRDAEVTTSKDGASAGILIGEATETAIGRSYIAGGSVQSKGSAGSFTGKASSCFLQNVYATSNVTSELTNAGGLVGTAEKITIENAYFSGTAQAKSACGGMVGSATNAVSILSCTVLSQSLKGIPVNRILGEKGSAITSLHNNYARADLLTGNRNLQTTPVKESFINGLQGESVPYSGSDYASDYPAYTDADILTALTALNNAYYSGSRKLYYEKSTRSGKVAAIWTQAIFLDLMENAYLRSGSQADSLMFRDILEGNARQYDNYNWDNSKVWFIYDDIMWWVISLARTYLITGEDKWLNLSKSGFERVWSGSKVLKDKGSYDPVNGGMYWAWDQQHPEDSPLPTMGKMACINYPTVIAAMTLFDATRDSAYFHKGMEIYVWAQNNLFDREKGRVADSRHGFGNPAWVDHVYNQATCIGAAVMLYKATGNRMFLDDAVLAANYTKNQMSTNGFLHFENGVEQGIYPAIFSQYIIRLIEDGEQYQYLPWLHYNIRAGWANHIPASGVTYKNFANPAPNISNIESYDASAIPALMQVIKPSPEEEKQVNCRSRIFYEKNLNWDFNFWTFPENDSIPVLRFSNIPLTAEKIENFTFHNGEWTATDDGLHSNLTGRGDGFALSATAAGRNFVYETSVEFDNRNESAASLVFGSTNDLDSKNMYVANINARSGVTRLFKFQKTGLRGQEALDLVAQRTVSIPADNKYHLSVTVLGNHILYSINGEVVANTADYTMGSIMGQNDAFTGHYLGLLSWNANCTYRNTYLTEITPANDPRLKNFSLQAGSGNIEHNVVFDSTQYVSITSMSNDVKNLTLNLEKKSPSTNGVAKIDDTDPDKTVISLDCTNGNARALYRIIVIRRKAADIYYNEFDRPQYHWSVKQHWTNDPNGMVYYNGEYHLFHQYYPGIDWGPMHWGHSVSTDLIHWTELPVALYPDEYGTMFSGSAVVDENNTSGLFKNEDGTPSATGGMVLIITADGNGERVTIAYSKDGRHFTKHDGVAIDWTEDPIDDRAFRDPKVFRYQNKWFLAIAGGPLRIYSSDNLIDWTVESTYTGIHTECPDLFPLPVSNGEAGERKWVLSRGGVGYKVGDFKQVSGKWTFVPDAHYASSDGNMNYGNDAYATQTYSMGNFDVPQRVVSISWQNFRASNIGKDNGNKLFNGQMTIQNELSLIKDTDGKYILQQKPLTEYETLRDPANAVTLDNQAISGTQPVNFTGQSYEIEAEFELAAGVTEVGFRVRSGNGYYTKIGYNIANNQFYNDRTRTGIGGYRDKFTGKAPKTAVVDGKLKMRIFVDRNCVEVFGADNTIIGSTLIYPAVGCDSLEIFSTGNTSTVNARIIPMRSIWNNTATAMAENKNYTHLIMYGQSLSTGHEAGTTLSAENIPGVYMLGKQVWFNYGNYDYIEINPLAGHPSFVMGNDLFEPSIMAAANHIRLKGLEDNIIASSTGDSGKSIEDLSKESEVHRLYGVYTQTLNYGKQAAERTQSSISCPAIFWLQGEWNYTIEGSGLTSGSKPTSSKDEYKALLVKLKNNMQADAMRIYRQQEKPVFYTYQTGAQYTRGRTVSIGMAQLEASNEYDDIICAGPVYPMTDYGGHLDANGYRWYGEMLGKVYHKHKILGEDFKPLQPKKISRDANDNKKIIIQFLVPASPLVLDEKTLPKEENYGFDVYMSRRRQTIESVKIINGDCVEITCAAPLTDEVEVIYAAENTKGHGNLRDSDGYQAVFNYVDVDEKDASGNYIYPRNNRSLRPSYEPKDDTGAIIYGKPYPLYNFCVAFNYRLAAGENEKKILTGINHPKEGENNIRIIQAGKTLRIVAPDSDTMSVRIYDMSGKLLWDFGKQQRDEYSLANLNRGIYIVSVKTSSDSINQKISI